MEMEKEIQLGEGKMLGLPRLLPDWRGGGRSEDQD